ncbi:hypothetical protein TPHA_0F02180 [Tetrapisispora phaffii CBS 4417]|uniref:Uncharacterized protein n=1 Tax=Tetrapisispora phaffii (strain ATCC 24235 / CBS 4417 / NBRC 1672 / NRRL Y-8282 / UCD 70-5) TaxID=1071381 RepID=G8BVB8_TETPH|nr:hypothetical protein TPHA_0F02180 [Tetrapisispora phaffii CBS 4417]CCE63700.1 hypothetical protein TPHA_0F02180 [Tetrapisispora phaffii CBS 4417]
MSNNNESDIQKENDLQTNDEQAILNCPQCDSFLQKCLIQQNYAMVLCPNRECLYPFNEVSSTDNLFYVEGSEMLNAATERLSTK